MADQRFGILTVLNYEWGERRDGGRETKARVRCDCGTEKLVRASSLSGRTRSCGCLLRVGITKHGDSGGNGYRLPLYSVWSAVRARCRDLEDHNYGGKGITVAEEWQDWSAFKSWALIHGYQKGLELDRINPDGPYSPANCRWLCSRDNIKRARASWDADFSAKVAQYASDHNLTPWELVTEAVGLLIMGNSKHNHLRSVRV